MATVTPNYSWPVPTSTDLVKDGATAIEALGDAIDATVYGLTGSGLVRISTTTIGTATTSVTVSSAFSATYDNYKIIVAGGVASVDNDLYLALGASVTGYYMASPRNQFSGAAATPEVTNNGASWTKIGRANTNTLNMNVDLQSPFLAKNTLMGGFVTNAVTAGQAGSVAGFHNSAVSYTSFTISMPSGNMTGGTIKVYGYNN
jgi:hypothetical protein